MCCCVVVVMNGVTRDEPSLCSSSPEISTVSVTVSPPSWLGCSWPISGQSLDVWPMRGQDWWSASNSHSRLDASTAHQRLPTPFLPHHISPLLISHPHPAYSQATCNLQFDVSSDILQSRNKDDLLATLKYTASSHSQMITRDPVL